MAIPPTGIATILGYCNTAEEKYEALRLNDCLTPEALARKLHVVGLIEEQTQREETDREEYYRARAHIPPRPGEGFSGGYVEYALKKAGYLNQLGLNFMDAPYNGRGDFKLPGNDRVCPGCKRRVSGSARYCMYCRYSLFETKSFQPARVCPMCGHRAQPEARFCTNCAYRLPPNFSDSDSSGPDTLKLPPPDEMQAAYLRSCRVDPDTPTYRELLSDGKIELNVGDEFTFDVSSIVIPGGWWKIEQVAEPCCEVVSRSQRCSMTPGDGGTETVRLRAKSPGEGHIRAVRAPYDREEICDILVIVKG
jgi:hypothetical protein